MGSIVRAGMTQKELASRIGMSKNTMNAKINGRAPFNTNEIDSICDELSITSNVEKALIFLSKSSQKRDENTKDKEVV